MSYTKEMCLYLLDNPDNIEAESLTESVERQVFQAMNKAISMRVGDRTPWRGQYALVTGDDEEHEDACPLETAVLARRYTLWYTSLPGSHFSGTKKAGRLHAVTYRLCCLGGGEGGI